jgi:hypothetical protein
MDDATLTEEMVSKVINSMPSKFSQAQMCDLIVNMLMAYGMEEDFPYMSFLIIGTLDNIKPEEYVRDATKPIH